MLGSVSLFHEGSFGLNVGDGAGDRPTIPFSRRARRTVVVHRTCKNDLLENVFTLFVNCSTRLENDRGKIVVRILKSIAIPVDFLMLCIRFARFSLTKVTRR